MYPNALPFKPASAWSPADLDGLAHLEEGTHLEYKKYTEFVGDDGRFSWDRMTSELCETVSAFLNSDGGTLLIGIQTEKGRARGVETLLPVKCWKAEQPDLPQIAALTAGQIRDRIAGNILPPPFGIEVKELQVMDAGNGPKVFVVTVPASTTGAHQSARTQRYYRRAADGDHPMLHHEIRDVNSRRAGPLLEVMVHAATDSTGAIRLASERVSRSNVQIANDTELCSWMVLMVRNHGLASAYAARLDIGVQRPWFFQVQPRGMILNPALATMLGSRAFSYITSAGHESLNFEAQHRSGVGRNAIRGLSWYTIVYMADRSDDGPIWPSADLPVTVRPLSIARPIRTEPTWESEILGEISTGWIVWRVVADGMPQVRGGVHITRDGRSFEVTNFPLGHSDWAGENESSTIESLNARFGAGTPR